MALIEAGYDLVLATPSGAKPHIDAASDLPQHFGGDQNAYQRAKAFYADHPSMNEVSTLRSVIERGLQNYLGAFVPGGQAPAVDLMQDADAGEISAISTIRESRQPFSATARSRRSRRCLERGNFARR